MAGYEVVVFDNFSNSHPEALERVAQITGRKPSLIHGDIRNEMAIEAERNLGSMCKDHWRWQKQNPEGYVSAGMHFSVMTMQSDVNRPGFRGGQLVYVETSVSFFPASCR